MEVVWQDAQKGTGKMGTKVIFCKAHGATNAEDRKKLLKKYQALEDKIKKEVEVFGILDKPPDKILNETISEYLTARKEEVEIRLKRGGKQGISKGTFDLIRHIISIFKNYCETKKIKFCQH